MKREILFRGFCPDEKVTQEIWTDGTCNGEKVKGVIKGEWIEGYSFKSWDKCYILWGTTNDIPNMIEVIPETVGQFTGRKDKKGKKIFEGDYAILKDSKGQMRLKCVYVDVLCGYFWERSIYLNKQGWQFDSLDKLESHRNIEIIGNIHGKEDSK